MNITLQRINIKGEITEGKLVIDGLTICDTIENSYSNLAPGHYRIHLHKCRQHARKMLLLTPICNQSPIIDNCSLCKRLHNVSLNTTMPRFCPMLKPGNGIHNRHDGSIVVGTRSSLGCIIHPRNAFAALYDRIRKNVERGRVVTLEIKETLIEKKWTI